jgi:hypothetical protein
MDIFNILNLLSWSFHATFVNVFSIFKAYIMTKRREFIKKSFLGTAGIAFSGLGLNAGSVASANQLAGSRIFTQVQK